MAAHDYNPRCGCPGCQYIWASIECYKKNGPPPVIGTFEPITGDIGRDSDTPTAQYRVWAGTDWHPNFQFVPRRTL